MIEMIYNNETSKDLDEFQCMGSTWQKFVWSTPMKYAWHYGVGQTLKHQQWVDWPASSSRLKRISLPPQPYRSASWLRRDYPNSSSCSKTAYLFPCPYQPPSQLLRVSSSLLKAKGTVGASVCLLVVLSV